MSYQITSTKYECTRCGYESQEVKGPCPGCMGCEVRVARQVTIDGVKYGWISYAEVEQETGIRGS